MRLVLIFLFLATLFFSCSFLKDKNDEHIWSHMKENVGEYQLNISKSDLGNYSTTDTSYRLLKLNINSDTTFDFSFDTPFITQVKGKWTMTGDDMSQRCVFLYDNTSYDHVILDTNNSVHIKFPRGKKNKDGANFLYFDRIK